MGACGRVRAYMRAGQIQITSNVSVVSLAFRIRIIPSLLDPVLDLLPYISSLLGKFNTEYSYPSLKYF